jgi:antitoxin (DNA-binding transcriptional repressor) of toxin-antitoxin stability system
LARGRTSSADRLHDGDGKVAETKAVGVRELKNQLSAYLRAIKAGDHILVTDRGRVIAEMRPPGAAELRAPERSRVDEWAEEGRLVPHQLPSSSLPRSPLHLDPGTSGRLLDEERREPA